MQTAVTHFRLVPSDCHGLAMRGADGGKGSKVNKQRKNKATSESEETGVPVRELYSPIHSYQYCRSWPHISNLPYQAR
jgi:hypothetical protein